MWERWDRLWHGLFFVTLTIPTVLAAVGDGPPRERAVTVGLALALATWHAVVGLRLDLPGTGRWPVAVYWAGTGVAAYLLCARDAGFASLLYGLLPFVFVTFQRASLLGAAAITTVVFAGMAGPRSLTDDEILRNIAATTVLAWMVGLFIDRIAQQSAERYEALQALEATRAELAATARHAGVLEERQRLAREIHDTVAQGLTSVVTQLEAAEGALDADPDAARAHLDRARRTAREGLGEVRRTVRALRPELLEGAGLADALDRTVRRWSAEHAVPATVTTTGDTVPLHPDAEVALLRLAQEALTNTARHARATAVTVTLSYVGDTVALDVDDDGVGFDPAARPAPAAGGFGLQGMRERVSALGGRLEVESLPGRGTTVAATVPVGAGP